MTMQYACELKGRVAAVRKLATAGLELVNGIEYLEVGPEHRQLLVHFVHDLGLAPSMPLQAGNVRIKGGERVRDPKVTAVQTLGNVLTVDVATPGDFSTYRLRLVRNDGRDLPPDGIDPALSEVAFSFKVDCPSDFDCRPVVECPPKPTDPPQIDYLAKDYSSFRRVMLDRLSALVPGWSERSPADLTMMLVELLAFRADELSYNQDAVAVEAYLGTARQRTSVRRHARLLDYPFHDGCNARVWVCFDVTSGGAADGIELQARQQLITQVSEHENAAIDSSAADDALDAGSVQAFELLQALTLHAANSRIHFYTWSDEECCLPAGATRAYLSESKQAPFLQLAQGDVLIFEETTASGDTRSQVVRLTYVEPELGAPPRLDPVTQKCYVEIRWDTRDALVSPICLSRRVDGAVQVETAMALGNVALADHGRRFSKQQLPKPDRYKRYRPLLPKTRIAPLTVQGHVTSRMGELLIFDAEAPATAALEWDLDRLLPDVKLHNARDGSDWTPCGDLIDNNRFHGVFVAEAEQDGATYLRFGNDVNGRGVREDDDFKADYRIGNGRAGNVGANAIKHIVAPITGISAVRNPLPAGGGRDPQSMEQAKLYAPQGFRRQERAVTLDDYARVAERHPQVQRAVATRRWTGSWHTIFLSVDRRGGAELDADFETELLRFLGRYRLAGHDLEINGPRFVSLDLSFEVCARGGHFSSDVERRLLRIFSRDVLPDGTLGFFHPDRYTFGSPVYLSEMIAQAMRVPGVEFIAPQRFQRWGQTAAGEREAGIIRTGRLEIARLDNDANAPEHGRLEFSVHATTEARVP